MSRIFCGTSGFAYASWKPDFYPAKVPAKDFLKHYATRLNAVEVNYTFRQLPKQTTLENWVSATPESFSFPIKMHQRVTHIARLKESEFEQVFYKAIDPLRTARRLGPVLVQLPPNLKSDSILLRDFLQRAPKELRLALEMRHASWFQEETYQLLEEFNAALCLAESEKLETPHRFTSDFVYFRLRKEDYSAEERLEIAQQAETLLAQGRDVFVFFKHEETPAGALYAEELLKSLATN
jgi:uncharacterized protein YecE (DUF72 family)